MKPLDEDRRAHLRAKLDAYYARLYGLTRDEFRYTPFGVDPKELYEEDPSTWLRASFPCQTFRVPKEKVPGSAGDLDETC